MIMYDELEKRLQSADVEAIVEVRFKNLFQILRACAMESRSAVRERENIENVNVVLVVHF